MEIKPIAHIFTDFTDKFGIPRQSGRVEELVGRIVFEKEFSDPSAIRGIEEFSHLWLIFDFSESHKEGFTPTVRPPRLGGNERVGVFASRSPFRPNSLGLSCVKLLSVSTEKGRTVILVGGVDLLNGTPIYDIKPYIPHSDLKLNAVGGYADTFEHHAVKVSCSEELLSVLPEDKRKALIGCLKEDPRPAYQTEEREYKMDFAGFNVTFVACGDEIEVIKIEKRHE